MLEQLDMPVLAADRGDEHPLVRHCSRRGLHAVEPARPPDRASATRREQTLSILGWLALVARPPIFYPGQLASLPCRCLAAGRC